MSRSYKKTPIVKDSSKFGKRQANKKVRRSKLKLNGGQYKRIYEQWNISDWSFEIDKNSKKAMSK